MADIQRHENNNSSSDHSIQIVSFHDRSMEQQLAREDQESNLSSEIIREVSETSVNESENKI